MSANTYFVHPDRSRRVYKTQDPAVRRRLVRQGWRKERRDELERAYSRGAFCRLAESADGEYAYEHTPGQGADFRPAA